MKRYAVLTDSTCDLSQELADQHGIDILCFKLALDGEGYVERVDFAPEAFCQMLRTAKGIPTTAQITQYEFLEKYEAYHQAGIEDVLYVSINGTGSSTNAAAHAAAQAFRNKYPESTMTIRIVDSHTYSIAQGMPIVEACGMLESGISMAEVVEWLEDRYARMEVLLAAYSLKVIRKSGRISAASAIAGELLGIHPIFTLNDGISQVVKKVRGEKQVVHSMATITKQRMVKDAPYYIGFSDRSRYEHEYADVFTEVIGYAPAALFDLGAAVQSNTGPEAVGIVFEGCKRTRG